MIPDLQVFNTGKKGYAETNTVGFAALITQVVVRNRDFLNNSINVKFSKIQISKTGKSALRQKEIIKL